MASAFINFWFPDTPGRDRARTSAARDRTSAVRDRSSPDRVNTRGASPSSSRWRGALAPRKPKPRASSPRGRWGASGPRPPVPARRASTTDHRGSQATQGSLEASRITCPTDRRSLCLTLMDSAWVLTGSPPSPRGTLSPSRGPRSRRPLHRPPWRLRKNTMQDNKNTSSGISCLLLLLISNL